MENTRVVRKPPVSEQLPLKNTFLQAESRKNEGLVRQPTGLSNKFTDYLALLRGVNVGGKNTLKMDELKKLFEKMNCKDIKTYIQSGNILFRDCGNDKLKLAHKIEKALLDKTHNEIKVAILTLSDMQRIIQGIPDGFGGENQKYKYDVIFLPEPLTTKGMMKEIETIESDDRIYDGKRVFYVKRNIDKLTGSYISKIAKIWQNVTVRNLNTTRKLYELMLERNQ